MEEKKSSCWGNGVWISRCINNDSNFRTIRIMTQGTKLPIFWWSTLLQLEGFWLRPKWKDWALYSWRKRSCNKEIYYYLRFLVCPQSGDHRTTSSSVSILKVSFLTPEKLGYQKKLIPKNLKRNQKFTFLTIFLADLWTFNFLEHRKNSIFFRRLSRNTAVLQLRRKKNNFREKESPLIKNPKFCRKKPYFWY